MSKKLHEFISHCPKYQINQTPRYRPYVSFPKKNPARPFHTLTIDFILILPESTENFNCAMSMTDIFNKKIIHIPEMTNWLTIQWATTLLNCFILFGWRMFKTIISNLDQIFVNDIWKHIFQWFNINFMYFVAWHFRMNGMSKRSNQTAEIV